MKVYISADIEGVTGSTHWDETYSNKPDYAEFRDQMTAEVAAACEGALEGGASEVWVQDAHGEGRNIAAARLPRATRLIRSWSGHPYSMVQELDAGFGAVAMVGYHAPSSSDANPLAHSMTTGLVHLKFNGVPASEFTIHALAAARLGVPTVFVSGDEGICADAEALVPAIRSVGVKRGVGGSTISVHPQTAVERIRAGMAEAVAGDRSACLPALPPHFAVELAFKDHGRARRASFYPGAEARGSHTIHFAADDYDDVLRMMQFVLF